ncbi:MAG: type II secretion system F family protein [Patescibacteria group bacterium]|nr:type II secretion system F family protein [Patescibacteria group bacterium]
MKKTISKKPNTPNTPKPFMLSLSAKDKIVFAKHLASMLDAGIPLHEALNILKEQIDQSTLKYIISVAIADLADGLPLHTCFAKFPKIFDSFFVNSISVGETSGTLSDTLRYMSIQLEKSQEVKSKVRSALLYPVIVFMGSIGIAIYLAFFMLPKILPLFTTLNVQLPPTTRALLAISAFMTSYWPFVVVGIVFVVVAFSLMMRINVVSYTFYKFILYIPVLNTLFREMETAQFSRILGTLLSSGVAIVPALKVTANSIDNPVYRKELEIITVAVDRGETIGEELQRHPLLFSRIAASMVGVGERTGKLSESLISMAEFTEKEVDGITQNFSTLIEPVTLMLVGLLVGFVALSIITPIYQITQGIHM